ncbi:MAG: MFS transporter [Acidimicrobiia bacterium]|nr:MFS transporter [Acidimicrobiia bacterium]
MTKGKEQPRRARAQLRTEIRNLGGPGGTGPATMVPAGLRHGMRAFRVRDFRIFFAGALLSNSGNWLQNIAVPFVLFELTGRSIWVGLAGFAQFIPAFLLGPVGGALADRHDRRAVLLTCQGLMAVAAFLLWGTWAIGWRSPWLVLALTAATGVFSGLMVPSWQAFVPSLVRRQDLPSAITLNSTQFNASRAVGPALAGVLLATGGPGLAFFLNGASFVAVIAALWIVRPQRATPSPGRNESIIDGFRSAIQYIRTRTAILVGIVCAMLVGFFGNPVTQFTVVFAERVYAAGPRVLGVLAAAIGIGAIAIAPMLSIWDSTLDRSTVVRYGLPGYAVAITVFGLAPSWPLGLAALALSGAGFLVVVASTNTALQLTVADNMRGRVISIRVMGFTLAFPLGSLVQGALADLIGPRATVTGAGLTLLGFSAYLAAKPALLATLDRTDDTPDRVLR